MLQRFGTLRELTLGGFAAGSNDTFGGILSNGLGKCRVDVVNGAQVTTCLNS
jgi:hypothetical protein